MTLYDVTNKDVLVKPKDAENYEALVKLKSKVDPRTWERIIRTIDEGVDSVQPSEKSKLTWTKAAALFGYGSSRPHRDVEHLHLHLEKTFGPEKEALMALGGLLRWRISLRTETWLVYRQDSGMTDPFTGKPIKISEYWINENYKPKTKPSLNDLAAAWGARVTAKENRV